MKQSLEAFTSWCDSMTIAEEGKIINALNNIRNKKSNTDQEDSYENKKEVSLFGKKCTLIINENDDGKFPDEGVLKYMNSKKLYDYLYEENKSWLCEHNGDPYFHGKAVRNGTDLMNAIKDNDRKNEYNLFMGEFKKSGITYFCGEYWIDPEHGFSISFPNGKFVTSGDKKTGLGAFSVPL